MFASAHVRAAAKPWLHDVLVLNDRPFVRLILRRVRDTGALPVQTRATTVLSVHDHAARWHTCFDRLEARRKEQAGSGVLQSFAYRAVLIGLPAVCTLPWLVLVEPGSLVSWAGMAVSWALGGCAVGAIIHHPQFSCESAASRKTEEETYEAFEYCILWSSVEADVENTDKAKAIEWDILAKLLHVSDQDLKAVFARIA